MVYDTSASVAAQGTQSCLCLCMVTLCGINEYECGCTNNFELKDELYSIGFITTECE